MVGHLVGNPACFYLTMSPTTGVAWYFLDDEEEVQGPFSEEQMVEWVQHGHLDGTRLVAQEGEDDWRELGFLDEFVPYLT